MVGFSRLYYICVGAWSIDAAFVVFTRYVLEEGHFQIVFGNLHPNDL